LFEIDGIGTPPYLGGTYSQGRNLVFVVPGAVFIIFSFLALFHNPFKPESNAHPHISERVVTRAQIYGRIAAGKGLSTFPHPLLLILKNS